MRRSIRITSTDIPFEQLRRILCYPARSVGPLLLPRPHPATSSNRPRTCATSGMQGRSSSLQGQIVSHRIEVEYTYNMDQWSMALPIIGPLSLPPFDLARAPQLTQVVTWKPPRVRTGMVGQSTCGAVRLYLNSVAPSLPRPWPPRGCWLSGPWRRLF